MGLAQKRRAGVVRRRRRLRARLGRGGLSAPEAAFTLSASCRPLAGRRSWGSRALPPQWRPTRGLCEGPGALRPWLLYLPHLSESWELLLKHSV